MGDRKRLPAGGELMLFGLPAEIEKKMKQFLKRYSLILIALLVVTGFFIYQKYEKYQFEKNALYEMYKPTCTQKGENERQCRCAFDKTIEEHGLDNYKEFLRILVITQVSKEQTEEIVQMKKQVNGWINAINRYNKECE